MKKKEYKRIVQAIFERRQQDYNNQMKYHLMYKLPTDELEKENPNLFFTCHNDSSSDESEDEKNVRYNARENFMNESDFIDQNSYDEGDSTCDENDSLWEQYGYHESSDKVRALKKINQCLETESQDEINDFFIFNEPHIKMPALELRSWFPVLTEGTCRFIGMIKSDGKDKEIITEVVFNYNPEDGLVKTSYCQYKLEGPIDLRYLPDDVSSSNTPPITMTKETWLKDVIELNRKSIFSANGTRVTRLHGISGKKLLNIKLKQFSRIKKNNILHYKFKQPECLQIRSELESLLKICQNGGHWQMIFKDFLTRTGQKKNVMDNVIFDRHLVGNVGYRNVDIDAPDDYDDFVLKGEMFNSTIKSSRENLYLWALLKNNQDKFCVTGFKKIRDTFEEVVPTIIKSVSSEGTSILTEEDNFNLVGPMYQFSVYCCYPNTNNHMYLDLFQEHFMKGLPKYWKSLVIIIHVICNMCTKLKYNMNSSKVLLKERNVKSSPFNLTSMTENKSQRTIQSRSAKKFPEFVDISHLNSLHTSDKENQEKSLTHITEIQNRSVKVKKSLEDTYNSIEKSLIAKVCLENIMESDVLVQKDKGTSVSTNNPPLSDSSKQEHQVVEETVEAITRKNHNSLHVIDHSSLNVPIDGDIICAKKSAENNIFSGIRNHSKVSSSEDKDKSPSFDLTTMTENHVSSNKNTTEIKDKSQLNFLDFPIHKNSKKYLPHDEETQSRSIKVEKSGDICNSYQNISEKIVDVINISSEDDLFVDIPILANNLSRTSLSVKKFINREVKNSEKANNDVQLHSAISNNTPKSALITENVSSKTMRKCHTVTLTPPKDTPVHYKNKPHGLKKKSNERSRSSNKETPKKKSSTNVLPKVKNNKSVQKRKRTSENHDTHISCQGDTPKVKKCKFRNVTPEPSDIDKTILISQMRPPVNDRFSKSYQTLKIKNQKVKKNCELIYQPTRGFEINLNKIAVTKYGRMSLPPPDILSGTRFEKVGNEAHFISKSIVKMVFQI